MKRILTLCAFLCCVLGATADARVVRVEIVSRVDINDGKAFDAAGPYEKIVARVFFADKPGTKANASIVDLDLAPRALFVACDHAAALSGAFDLIVSNPPYIRSSEIAGLAPEVRDHDPIAALDGGTDGLDAYRALIPQAERLLKAGGMLVVEAGRGQSGDIEALMTATGLSVERPPKTDLAGVPRAVSGRKRPP